MEHVIAVAPWRPKLYGSTDPARVEEKDGINSCEIHLFFFFSCIPDVESVRTWITKKVGPDEFGRRQSTRRGSSAGPIRDRHKEYEEACTGGDG